MLIHSFRAILKRPQYNLIFLPLNEQVPRKVLCSILKFMFYALDKNKRLEIVFTIDSFPLEKNFLSKCGKTILFAVHSGT